MGGEFLPTDTVDGSHIELRAGSSNLDLVDRMKEVIFMAPTRLASNN